MKVKFWGVRGSLPTPITPQQVQSKIMAAIQRITADDVATQESKAKFISNLPDWIFGTAGGNTPCVELEADGEEFILDAGTGLRVLGKTKTMVPGNHYNLFISHFHWDHIQGLPFFDAAYNPDSVFDVYSAKSDAQKILRDQMNQPYYPVSFDSLTKNFNFHTVTEGEAFYIKSVKVNSCTMFHPGNSQSYSFEHNGKKFVYATDVELKAKDFYNNPAGEAVFKNADCIVLDSQYTVEEAYRKENWGHSAFCYAIDFAVHWGIKKVYLFHHEPTYDDKKLNSILQAARWYAQYTEHSEIEIYIAKEGLEITL